jgi:hypothetical protein
MRIITRDIGLFYIQIARFRQINSSFFLPCPSANIEPLRIEYSACCEVSIATAAPNRGRTARFFYRSTCPLAQPYHELSRVSISGRKQGSTIPQTVNGVIAGILYQGLCYRAVLRHGFLGDLHSAKHSRFCVCAVGYTGVGLRRRNKQKLLANNTPAMSKWLAIAGRSTPAQLSQAEHDIVLFCRVELPLHFGYIYRGMEDR